MAMNENRKRRLHCYSITWMHCAVVNKALFECTAERVQRGRATAPAALFGQETPNPGFTYLKSLCDTTIADKTKVSLIIRVVSGGRGRKNSHGSLHSLSSSLSVLHWLHGFQLFPVCLFRLCFASPLFCLELVFTDFVVVPLVVLYIRVIYSTICTGRTGRKHYQ